MQIKYSSCTSSNPLIKRLLIIRILAIIITVVLCFWWNNTLASPKREFRAAWIATVVNLDWPSSRTLSVTNQKLELTKLLDSLKIYGINAVIFQIRTECDAFYYSQIEPWSYWLTNSQGTPPSPFYDPLQFAIEESHKRGLELHAWFNPYRAYRNSNTYTTAPNHVTNLHPDWVITCPSGYKFLDPGLPAVRNYVTDVIYDVVNRYDVDGIHFDDYFYPYPEHNFTNQDAATFANHSRGFTNIGDWRRDNVNIFIKQVNDTIKSIKPWVKFGISPFGIWKNGVPQGISGLDAYSTIYCDAMAWLKAKSIDYLTPQLYWKFGGGQDYAKLQPWWADSVAKYGLHYYPGHALYKVNPNDANWAPEEIPNQIRFDRSNPKVQGGVFFRTKSFTSNFKGVTDSLKNDLYKYKALLPIMNWKDTIPPNPPQNVRYTTLSGNRIKLIWDLPQTASDGDSAKRYTVYRFTSPNIQSSDLNNSTYIMDIVGFRECTIPAPPNISQTYYYVVTSLDRNFNESGISNVLAVSLTQPLLTLNLTAFIEGLFDGSKTLSDTITIQFRSTTSPFNLVDNKKILFDSLGKGTSTFTNVAEGSSYYLVIKHRNSIETWSKNPVTFSYHTLTYDFTTDSTKAFGNNLKKVGNEWCIYSGDVNQDGFINSTDLLLIESSASNFLSGYLNSDLNGDNFIDLNDLVLCDDNVFRSVNKLTP